MNKTLYSFIWFVCVIAVLVFTLLLMVNKDYADDSIYSKSECETLFVYPRVVRCYVNGQVCTYYEASEQMVCEVIK